MQLSLREGVWKAPDAIKDKFTPRRTTLAFPECMVSGNESSFGLNANEIDTRKRTMFVCDLIARSRVGNDNSNKSTGGVFGMYVPMHLTAEYTKGAHKYKNDLIEFVSV